MASQPTIDTRELKAFRKQLRRAKPDSPEWAREFATINKRFGDVIASDAGGRLGGARGSRSARAIKGAASQQGVRVRVSSTGSAPHALADVFGTKRRSGWYARERYAAAAGRQHPPWIGNSWKPGDPGEGPGRGPYGLGPAIHARADEVVEAWADAVRDLMARFAGR